VSARRNDENPEAREPLSLPQGDARLIAHIRGQIVGYRLNGQPLGTMVAAIERAFNLGSERLRRTRDALYEPLLFLEAVVASGSDHSTAVDKALDEIDAPLRSMLEQHAA
jgi:hypothetical protein